MIGSVGVAPPGPGSRVSAIVTPSPSKGCGVANHAERPAPTVNPPMGSVDILGIVLTSQALTHVL